ncbi:Uncharacterised protein [Mycolicibacterium vanbaalenii]|uniref:Uncharacterized protein n=1 Tax=Mycolicibacterium vanbaalenii TaxID=110539 RepID=A0A5S9RA01_MYCVN|nr:Uncharacterised protein [Mycolicibacterium vanbaalenii]
MKPMTNTISHWVAHGTGGVNFYTRQIAITQRWLDPSSRTSGGINLGFPQNQ